MQTTLSAISDFVWGPFLLIPLLLLTGLYLTIVLRGIQFHKLFHALWLALVRRHEPGGEGDITHYQALATALAATVGVGNIAGVATAVHLGGPGAIFWMWVTGLVGMATKYSEAFLGVRFRRADARGEQSGGPMFYLTYGVGGKFGATLGVLFAVFGALAAFGIGNMVQSNSVADALHSQWGIPMWLTGAIITVLAAIVILGGIKSIGAVTSAFVPVMIVLYILGALWIIIANIGNLPGALATIVTDAFTGTAATGGFVGSTVLLAIRYGVARGIFSNESGLGTGGIAAAAAKTNEPVRQALVSMTQTFIDTLVVVSMTGLAIVVTGAWRSGENGAPLTTLAFSHGLPGQWGGVVVTIGLVFFAFSTLLGWAYYGERCMDRLFGRVAVTPYRLLFIALIFVGTVLELQTVWTFSDIMNGLMALPNLIGLLMLSGLVVRETRAYFNRPDWEKIPTA
ncbi:sodium:alanine symporter family protein [Spongiactinospora gelatinilytica]|uniref:Sodium:alanine symporter family protein n=1 Tax=Spongiactinospora gelatinilytica TaxID=2666298 RepID=A0A2W2HRV9_9ACTN|nr:sodium:alanine symporter family protein [Spongiactinospora gelatinilytica]PZG48677.1 sodium:alanine symporter family protein [Spongiactinospora gelatinilytica]